MKLLIVVDMQKDFIDGALGSSEAQAIVPSVKKMIEEYQAAGDDVIFTLDTHDDKYMDTQEGKKDVYKRKERNEPLKLEKSG